MQALCPLDAELRQWKSPPSFWWRNDDVYADTKRFRLLLCWSERMAIPGLMGVIPYRAGTQIAGILRDYPKLRPAQHGWRHENHENASEKKSEFGPARPSGKVLDDLRAGSSRMEQLFGAAFLPVMVAPWNSFHDDHLPLLGAVGLYGLSKKGEWRSQLGSIARADVHLDMMVYENGRQGPRGPRTPESLLAALLPLLTRLRSQTEIRRNPIGILTHHEAIPDERCWSLLNALVAFTTRHGCEWLDPLVLFGRAAL
jgi:hypothetical protein